MSFFIYFPDLQTNEKKCVIKLPSFLQNNLGL